MLSLIPSEIDIILLVETCEHEEFKFPNIEGFVLWSTWNKRSYHGGIKGIDCYTKKNIFTHIRLHMNDLIPSTCGWRFHISMLRIFI